MNTVKRIRASLGITQAALAQVLGMTQANIGFYERGQQSVPPHVAKNLIEYASTQGVAIGYDDIYGVPNTTQTPASRAVAATENVAQGVANV